MEIKLKQVMDALVMANEITTYYFDSQTGENVCLTDPLYCGVSNDALTDLVECSHDRFFRYPTKHEIHEYRIMESFVASLSDGPAKWELESGIHKKGVFRNFKNGIRYHRLENTWYAYREEALYSIALRWCQEHGFEVVE